MRDVGGFAGDGALGAVPAYDLGPGIVYIYRGIPLGIEIIQI